MATHAAKHLYEIFSFYGLIHKTQSGGLPNRRCSDHIFQLLAKYQNCPASYSLYIDFNKAFNSVPHGSLFQTLEHYRLPSPLIRLIRGLYRDPRDYPVVNGHTGASHLRTRGVRQGCPLSPILFVLYVNILLFAVPHHLSTPITQHESSRAFVDDLLYRSESSQRIEEIVISFRQAASSMCAGSASTTQSPYMGQLLKTGLFSLFSALLVPFATFH